METLTITIISETGDFESSLVEVTKWVKDGNCMGLDENNSESFEWCEK